MVQTRKSQKRLHDTSSKVHASWSRPMPGSGKSASGTSGTCYCSRTGTAIRVTGTEDHLTRPDSENTSEPPDQVNRSHDQPELKKWRQWSCNQNKEIMYCYYMAIKDKPRWYWKRMHQQWKDRGNIECIEQWLCHQKNQIENKNCTKTCRDRGSETTSKKWQEEDDQQAEKEQQAAATILVPVELEVIPEPEHPIPPTYHEHQMMMMTMTMTNCNMNT